MAFGPGFGDQVLLIIGTLLPSRLPMLSSALVIAPMVPYVCSVGRCQVFLGDWAVVEVIYAFLGGGAEPSHWLPGSWLTEYPKPRSMKRHKPTGAASGSS